VASPHRFEAGTTPIVQAIGLGVALDWLSGLDRAAIAAHEADILAHATEEMNRIAKARILGRAPGKGAIMTFDIAGAHAHDVATLLDHAGVAVRAGTHCAQPLMKRYGVTSSCRASFALYNTHQEVDALVAAIRKALEVLA
jgi:cysteine desulfurase / selenocysteine lyase